MKKLLYVCEADSGGIMEYALRQSAAISREGVEVHFLCRPGFPVERLADGIVVEKFKENRASSVQRRGLAGKISTIWRLTFGQRRSAMQVADLAKKLSQTRSNRYPLPATRHRPRAAEVAILFACYKEYFAPFWVGPLRRLARQGVVMGTIAHDPVRDFVVGPLWWHRWSVGLGYSFVQHVFVHDGTPVDFGGRRPEGIKVHQIPHGPYDLAEPKIGRLEMRRRFGFSSGLTTEDTEGTEEETGAPVSESPARPASAFVSLAAANHTPPAPPAPPDIVFLAFGQIRDGKNLDLFLRAMVQLPENVKLLVAGKGDSGSSRRPEFYQRLAGELGVANRCRWDLRKIPDGEVGDIFAACDVVLATYGANFRSASGVLNAAVSARKPVLASSGPGPLKSAVVKYGLGVFVEPDDVGAMVKGVVEILEVGPSPEWGIYEKENSWLENAGIVLEAFSTRVAKEQIKR